MVFSLPDTARTRNIEHNPKVALNFAGDGSGGDIVIVSGRARLEPGPSADKLAPFVKKYAWGLERLRATPEQFAGQVLGADPDQAHQGPRARVIRLAEPADLDTVAALLCAFRDWWGASTPSDETMRGAVEQLLRDPNTEYLLAGTSGLAQLRFRLSAWTGVEDCWLEDVFVADDARGTGLGRALVEAAMERARARGCRRIELDVQESNEHAIRLYVKCGFSARPKGAGRTLFLSANSKPRSASRARSAGASRWRCERLVLVLPAPPLIRRLLRAAGRRVLPLLLAAEGRQVEEGPDAAERLDPAAAGLVGQVGVVAVAQEALQTEVLRRAARLLEGERARVPGEAPPHPLLVGAIRSCGAGATTAKVTSRALMCSIGGTWSENIVQPPHGSPSSGNQKW